MMLSAAQTTSEILSQAGMTVLIGMVVVFLVLILLTVVFAVFGKVMSASEKPAAKKTVEKKPFPVKKAPTAPAAPIVDDGVDDETVAAICAAIAAMTPEGKSYRVRRIAAARKGRSAWASAGVADATRPF